MNPRISVVIPVYNLEKYLERCLDSVINQTYHNLEIIIVNDGSSDGSKKIIDSYASRDSRIITIHKENSGVSAARNMGLNIATGDYIGFVDGDDIIELNMYEILARNAVEHNADISHCGYQLVKPNEVIYYHNTKEKIVMDRLQGIKELIVATKVEPGTVNKIFKSSVVKNIRMDSKIKYNEDYLFNIEAFDKAKKSVFEDLPLYHYMLRKGSAVTSNVNVKKFTDPLRVNHMVTELYKDNKDIYPYAVSREVNTNIITYRSLSSASKNDSSNVKKQIKDTLKSYKAVINNRSIISKKLRLQAQCIVNAPLVYDAAVNTIFKAVSKKNNYKVD